MEFSFDRRGFPKRPVLRGAPQAQRAIKHIVTVGRELPLAAAWEVARPYQDAAQAGEESKEGVRAFVEKRPTRFTGR